MVATFVAKEIILISSKCRVVKKCPPDGVVVDCQIQLMLHSTDESSNSCVGLLKDQAVSCSILTVQINANLCF